MKSANTRMDHAKHWNARITFDQLTTALTIDRNLKAFFTLMGMSDPKISKTF
jgi:hypothetical protein